MQQFQFDAIGTAWQINSSYELSREIRLEVADRIEAFDLVYSRFRADGLLKQRTAKPGEYQLPGDAYSLLDFYKKLYDATGGLVTPMIGKTMEQAGYDADYSLTPTALTAPADWEDAIDFTRSKLIVKQPVLLDFGAAGKGYLVDIISHLLYKKGLDQFCINAGGDMFMRNLAQTVGLEDPDDASRVLGTLDITNGALCSSSGNRRQWDRFHHIINPITLESPRHVKAVWVSAENAMLADGVATALFFVAPEVLLKTFAFEYAMIIGEDLKHSSNFRAQFFRG
jgi:thiamine biosynthesis lipoprotein